MTDEAQAENLLGALCLGLGDRLRDATTTAVGSSGQGESAAAALSALHHFLGSASIDLLRQVLGLTSSGTVRLVDRLEAQGLVRRGAGDDRRSTSVSLTPAGRAAAARVTEARREVLRGALAGLPAQDRVTLGRLAGQVMAGLVRPPGAVRWTCRLCDTGACRRDQGECPVANTALQS